ncbi:MAG: hypothetical protein ACSHYB_11545 [Roseibacillus sp.]
MLAKGWARDNVPVVQIGNFSRNPRLYSTGRLTEAAKEYGHEVGVVACARTDMNIAAVGKAKTRGKC